MPSEIKMVSDIDRYTEIEKENRRLLEKMTGLIKTRKRTCKGFTEFHNDCSESICIEVRRHGCLMCHK